MSRDIFPYYIVKHIIAQEKYAAQRCPTFAEAKYARMQLCPPGVIDNDGPVITYHESVSEPPIIIDRLTGEPLKDPQT